jgi:flagellar hook-length control protein FliK
MTIEKSPAAVSPHKATARADSQGNKAKSSEADASGGGFMAILGAMGDAPVAVATDAPSADAAATQSVATDSTSAQNPALDASTLLQQNPQIAAAQTQLTVAANATANANAAATTTANTAAAAPSATATTTAAATAAAAAAAAAVASASTATIATTTAASMATATTATSTIQATTADDSTDGSSDGATLIAKSDPVTSQLAQPLQSSIPSDVSQSPEASNKRPGPAPIQAAAGNSAAAIAEQTQPQITGESATQGLQHATGHAKSGKDSHLAAADTAPASSSTTAAPNEKAEAMKWMVALDQSKVPSSAKAMEQVFAPLLVKSEKSTGERATSAFRSAEPGYTGTAFGVSAPDYSQSGAPAPITAPEMQVAEQVTYWVSQNVQNAELKLDGLGLSPVEVSISVQGKEAQITFRTDEAATRGVLEAASAHLKDMLQREGMVLTGVSVGTSGSGDSSGAERRARQAARQGAIAPLHVASVTTQEVTRRVNTVAGRSVDLFV